MSITTKQKKAFTALATATAALGLLTGPALAQATPTASTGCTQWQFMGNFAFNQSNGYSVSFPATGTTVGETPDANGRIPGGDPPRTATAMPGAPPGPSVAGSTMTGRPTSKAESNSGYFGRGEIWGPEPSEATRALWMTTASRMVTPLTFQITYMRAGTPPFRSGASRPRLPRHDRLRHPRLPYPVPTRSPTTRFP